MFSIVPLLIARPPPPLGLFGGTFNPPHRGHLAAALAARRALGLDLVILIPSRVPPHKPPRQLAPARDRARMVRLLVGRRPGLAVSGIELRRRGPSFTLDTVRAMRRRHPRRPLYFIIGADWVRKIPTWHRWRDLLGLVRFAVVTRPGAALVPLRGYADRFVLVHAPGADVSASRIRARLGAGRSVGRDLPPAVRAYALRHGLYGARA